MDIILAVRQTARKEKMYKIADEIRDRLDAAGIVIEDTPTGARWKRRGDLKGSFLKSKWRKNWGEDPLNWVNRIFLPWMR